MKTTIKITNGPSREELFDGLRLFSEKRVVNFIIEIDGKEVQLLGWLRSIQAKDVSGHSWNIEFCAAKPTLCGMVAKMPYPIDPTSSMAPLAEVEAFFSTKTRKGTLSFEKSF